MLITLCYLYLWARWGAYSAGLIRRTVRRLHRTRCSFTFSCSGPGCPRQTPHQPYHPPSGRKEAPRLPGERICLRAGNKVFFTDETQSLDDLNQWTLLIVSPPIYSDKIFESEHIAFLTESISTQAGSSQAITCSAEKLVKWSDYCSPLAFKPGEPCILFAEASIDNFSSLGIAFMEDRLQMDNGMVPHKIMSVHLQKSELEELAQLVPSTEKEAKASNVQLVPTQESTFDIAPNPEEETIDSAGGGDQEVQGGKGKLKKADEHYEQRDHLSEKEMSCGEHHHLHLSSCHECLELENSTIESVKFASAENIPDLPDDYSGSFEDVGNLAGDLKRVKITGKPPNILIYVDSDSGEVKFEEIKSIIMECIDVNAYTVYQLLEEQVLSVPWVDNALLLVIATSEPISDSVSKQFLAFMSKGGKILGFSASFTFGGIQIKNKDELTDTVQALVFSKDKDNEIKLNVLASGRVFKRETAEISSVKLLGYFDSTDKDMMVVQMPFGNSGGEAILCQVWIASMEYKYVFKGYCLQENQMCRQTVYIN
ncbi:UNVERIFIED_CONTAM: hypothetical protein K2H54_055415 [Gekko kuhli]